MQNERGPRSEALNVDCMEYMRALPDNAFDLAVVDPPYGVGSVTYMPRTREKAFGGFIDHYDITIATLDMNQRKKVKVDIVHKGDSPETTEISEMKTSRPVRSTLRNCSG